jgi:uncharacterized repeat protein (TIGR03803 family)
MKSLDFGRFALNVGVGVALLAACGGSQPPIGAPGAMPQTARTIAHQPTSQLQNRVQPTGNGYKMLYSFTAGADGEYPSGGVTHVNHMLYSVTSNGGSGQCYAGCGTIFSITASGREKVLYSFEGGSDGAAPSGALRALHGTLYGTAQNGGTAVGPCYAGCGTIFKVSTSGEEQTVYRFQGGMDGYFPTGGLTALRGVLYGTTSNGGNGYGTVFRITTGGTEKIIYRFKGGRDGATPNGQLLALRNTLYGTTFYGGHCVIQGGCGTVFKVTASGAETVLYRFKGAAYYDSSKDGGNPAAGLLALNGTLYGTTAFGGNNHGQTCGTVFKMSTSGRERVIYRFDCTSGGAIPYSNLIADGGLLYGTTSSGGVPNSGYCEYNGCGVIFSVSTAGEERVLHKFTGAYVGGDGAFPYAGLTALNGRLYGVTSSGGILRCGIEPGGCGTVFKIAP